jgi:hypothetical protein
MEDLYLDINHTAQHLIEERARLEHKKEVYQYLLLMDLESQVYPVFG